MQEYARLELQKSIICGNQVNDSQSLATSKKNGLNCFASHCLFIFLAIPNPENSSYPGVRPNDVNKLVMVFHHCSLGLSDIRKESSPVGARWILSQANKIACQICTLILIRPLADLKAVLETLLGVRPLRKPDWIFSKGSKFV